MKRIAELHGGRVEAFSDGPGHGSRFTVTFHRIPTPVVSTPEKGSNGSQQAAPRRILIIEDNDDARDTLRAILEASGHEIHEAPDGPSGVAQAFLLRPDIILIDLGLPGLDGYQVAIQIRSNPACRAALLIALTGYGQEEYRRRAEAAGFRGFLLKPVDIGDLEKLIESVNNT